MAKRKFNDLELNGGLEQRRRSSRRLSSAKAEKMDQTTANQEPKGSKKSKSASNDKLLPIDVNGAKAKVKASVPEDLPKSAKASKSASRDPPALSVPVPSLRQYWLMKAEPESRLEKGHDVKFSIDDLAARTEPEPWDGIRAYAARNNLRAMKKGDLAFFYHSSCKTPAIVGVMEIVQEHSPDLSAHDPNAPYHDPSSTPENPKWSVVHVSFRQKLTEPITLKELKAWQQNKGHVLENMQMLKLARMSVSKVTEEEWRFIIGEMNERGDVVDL